MNDPDVQTRPIDDSAPESEAATLSLSRSWTPLIWVSVAGVAVFACLSVYGDFSQVKSHLAKLAWQDIAVALTLALANYLLRLLRWFWYLRIRQVVISRAASTLIFFAGFAFSVTPGKIGELFKSVLLRQVSDAPMTQTASIVIAERVTDLVGMLIIALIGVGFHGVGLGMLLAAIALIALGLILLAMPRAFSLCVRVVFRGRLARLQTKVIALYHGVRDLMTPSRLLVATSLSSVAWFAECLGFAVILNAFGIVDAPWTLATVIYATTTLAGALSFLPGGLLVTEATMTLFLVRAVPGLDESTAIAATIITRLVTLWFAVALGVISTVIFRRIYRRKSPSQPST